MLELYKSHWIMKLKLKHLLQLEALEGTTEGMSPLGGECCLSTRRQKDEIRRKMVLERENSINLFKVLLTHIDDYTGRERDAFKENCHRLLLRKMWFIGGNSG